jgi:hypothetical protein
MLQSIEHNETNASHLLLGCRLCGLSFVDLETWGSHFVRSKLCPRMASLPVDLTGHRSEEFLFATPTRSSAVKSLAKSSAESAGRSSSKSNTTSEFKVPALKTGKFYRGHYVLLELIFLFDTKASHYLIKSKLSEPL